MNNRTLHFRISAFTVAVTLVFSIFAADLFRIQIIHGDEYKSERVAYKQSDTTIVASRGEILDCNGKKLVTNKQINTVVFNGSYFPRTSEQKQRNEIIISLIRLFEKYKAEWNDWLPLKLSTDGKPEFEPDRDEDIKLLKSKSILSLNDYATAQNCLDEIKAKFELQDYSDADALKIASVCCSLKRLVFSTTNPYTFAEDIPVELASAIKENSRFYAGVEIVVTTARQYLNGTIAPHIIGITGPLNAEEYERETKKYEQAKQDETLSSQQQSVLDLRAYSLNDTIGKFGLESAMEEYLRGTNGVERTITDSEGNKTTEVITAPVQGSTVILTLNADLQLQVQDALKSFVQSHRDNSAIPAVGSAVVTNVNTGEILACATYPSYDLTSYYDNYSELSKDKASPLWNRALQSTYEPGSTFKLAVALAGLEEGVIDSKSTVFCNHIYDYFKDTPFKCLGKHGYVDVTEALNQSCNIFFYETGRKLGIEKMNDYCTRLGLGQKTGVEINESAGVLASIEYRQAHGGIWYPGDTVQAAIGQSDNLFTPIQLCNYVATVANGGTRYKAHFVKSIKSADYSQTIVENKPVVLNETGISKKSIDIVKAGMNRLGARLRAFDGLPVKVAAKTGTAESKAKVNGRIESGLNGFMVSFAPSDKPEIAVCVAIENLNSGSATAELVANIYKAYFNTKSEINKSQDINTVLP